MTRIDLPSINLGSIKYKDDFQYNQFALSKRQGSFWLELNSAQLETRVILDEIRLRSVGDDNGFFSSILSSIKYWNVFGYNQHNGNFD